jgi:CRISPR-associated endonuclease/helicase Cas3
MQLDATSRVRFRLPAEHVALVLPLSGKTLNVAGHRIRLGVPSLSLLQPSSVLGARVVTIKNATDPEAFTRAAQDQLALLGIKGNLELPIVPRGVRQGEPKRQVVRIKQTRVVGFAVRVASLTPDESLLLQERGIGGRRRMGCGLFFRVRGAGQQ